MPSRFLPLALQLAEAARTAILPFYRNNPAIDDKLDQSPVTQADKAAELAMRALLHEQQPSHGIIGEEFGREREDAEWVWVLDPIDGTKSFIVGRPSFCSLIGLLHYGKPVLGIIDQPVLEERWVGVQGSVTTFNQQPLQTASTSQLARAKVGSTGPEYLPGAWGERFNRLALQARFTVWGGDAYLYAMLAGGGLDLVVECGLKLHDYAALVPVLVGAGAVVTDWQGQPLDKDSDGSVLAAANGDLHQAALNLLKK